MKYPLLMLLPLRASGRAGQDGFSILESVVTALLLAIAVSGSAALLSSVNRMATRADSIEELNTAIDSNLTAIRNISTRFTCCSGICSTATPTTYGSTSACATNDPRDDRYYFPQMDVATTTVNFPNTTTSKEPEAVDQLCAAANNTVFMTPLKTAVDALPVPADSTRVSTIRPNHILEVSYTDTIDNRVVRIANITPPASHWCP